MVDKLGVRWSLALFVAWWTIANALTGMARSLGQICGLRFMLGLGEAGCYTASPKAVSEWFPASERGMAVGIYSAGGAVGATIAPVMVALIAGNFGWRWVFAVTPVLAVLWLLLWLWLYKNPAAHPNMTDREETFWPPILPLRKRRRRNPKNPNSRCGGASCANRWSGS